MKKLCLLLILILLTPLFGALAEEVPMVKFNRASFPADAREIDLGKVTVASDEYAKFYHFLDQFPNLERVNMFATEVTRRRVQQFVERYPNVEFGWTMNMGGHRIRTDATAFSTLHGSNSERHNEEDFSLLKYCKNLQALDIGHNAVKDLSFLYDLPHLKVLVLVDNKFQDITPISSLKELEYLELFYNDVRDVTALKDMTSLIDLNICYNRISDLSPLEGLTGLQRLWISHANSHNVSIKMDENQVERLRQALPNTTIDSTAKTSTEGGWREHPHYEVIRRIFAKGGQYEPFEDDERAALTFNWNK